MAPYAENEQRIVLGGKDCSIGPRAATPLALIFHELATNSAKYGALSVEGGRVEIEIDCPEDDGIARIELAPTMVSGSLRLAFAFDDGNITRRQELEAWIEPGDVEWTVIGLAEGSVGARSVADNMERAGHFYSDLGDNARVAFYAKGRVLGKFLLTASYDSAKQRDDQRLLGVIDGLPPGPTPGCLARPGPPFSKGTAHPFPTCASDGMPCQPRRPRSAQA